MFGKDTFNEEGQAGVDSLMVTILTGCIIANGVRKAKLREYLDSGETNGLTTKEHCEILSLLDNYHDVLSLSIQSASPTAFPCQYA